MLKPSPRAVEAAVKAYAHEYGLVLGSAGVDWAEVEHALEAALTAALAVDGLCLVPKEPTMAMLAAGETAWINDPLKRSSTLYRAMIAAASDGDSTREDNKK